MVYLVTYLSMLPEESFFRNWSRLHLSSGLEQKEVIFSSCDHIDITAHDKKRGSQGKDFYQFEKV